MKNRILSVLTFPYQDKFVVKVTRGTDHFNFGHVFKIYAVSYDSPLYESFVEWTNYLHWLNNNRIADEMKIRYMRSKSSGR